MKMHMAWVVGAVLIGCDDGAADDPLGCNDSVLVAQCPAGSNPILGVRADDACTAATGGIATDGQGQASGQCLGTASCRVLCQFAVPCRCGVAEVSRDGVVCASCEGAAACGNGICEGGETPDNCRIDCGMDCVSGERRCDGVVLEECDLQGRWDRLDCPAGEICSAEDGPAGCVRDDRVIMGEDMGVEDPDGGTPEEGRVIPGSGGWPAPLDTTRGMTPARLTSEEVRIRLTDGSTASRPTAFVRAQVAVAGNAGGNRIRPAAQLGYTLVPGADLIEGHSILGRFRVDFEERIVLPDVEFTADREMFCDQWQACIGGAMQPCDELIATELADRGPATLQCIADVLARGEPNACQEIFFGGSCGWDPRWRYPLDATFGGQGVDRVADWFVGTTPDRVGGQWVDLATNRVEQMAPVGEFELRGDPDHFALSADGRVAAFVGHAGRDEVLIIWDIEAGERRPILPLAQGAFNTVTLANDGRTALLQINGTQDPLIDRTVSVWDLVTENRLFSIRPPERANLSGAPVLSPDGRHLALLFETTAEIWDLSRQERLHILEQDGAARALDARFSPDGRFLMVHWTGALATQWDVATGQQTASFEQVGQVGFEPDGARGLGLGGEVFRGSFHILSAQP